MLAAVVVTVMIVAFVVMLVPGFEAQVRGLGRFRLGVVLGGVGRTQVFAFQAQSAPNKLPDWAANRLFRAASRRSGPQTANSRGRLPSWAASQGETCTAPPGKSLISW